MAKKYGKTTPPHPASPPANTTDGAAAVLKATVKLYDQGDGAGVDWRVIAETLFKAAFDVLDRLPDDQRQFVAKSVHAGSYRRFSGADAGDFAPSKTGPGEGVSPPSNT